MWFDKLKGTETFLKTRKGVTGNRCRHDAVYQMLLLNKKSIIITNAKQGLLELPFFSPNRMLLSRTMPFSDSIMYSLLYIHTWSGSNRGNHALLTRQAAYNSGPVPIHTMGCVHWVSRARLPFVPHLENNGDVIAYYRDTLRKKR